MTCLRRGFWLLPLAVMLAGCAEAARPRLAVTRGQRDGYETLTVENAKIRVSFLSAAGGRLTEYTLRRSGRNQFWVNPEFVRPEEVETYFAYGGLDDHLRLDGTEGRPPQLPSEPYECDLAESPDNVTVTMTWEDPRWRLVRTHVIFPDSTRLFTRVVVTNLDNAPRELTCRPHPVFAVGGDGDYGDYVLQPVDGATLVHRWPGGPGKDIRVPAGRWAAVLDSKVNEAVVLVFGDDDVDEVNLRFNESSYNLEPMRAPQTLRHGESLSMAFDLFLLSGEDLATEAAALGLGEQLGGEIAAGLAALAKHRAELPPASDFYLAPWGTFRPSLPRALLVDARPLVVNVDAIPFGEPPLPKPNAGLTFVRRSDGTTVDIPTETLDLMFTSPEGDEEVHALMRQAHPAGLKDDTYRVTLDIGPEGSPSRITWDVVVARELRERIEKSKPDDKGRWKHRYAAAWFYVEAAARAGKAVEGIVPPAKSVYGRIEKLLERSRDILDGKTAENATGTFARFYFSDIDDSVQGYHVHLPQSYVASQKWPLVVHLYGEASAFGSFDPDRADAELDALADRFGVVLVRPYGRGNTGYRGAGADDVFSVLEQVREDYSIDPERIYLSGQSLGGYGAWSLATRHPGVFAAVASVFGPADRWVRAGEREGKPEWMCFRLDTDSPLHSLENLLHTPAYLYHGLKDGVVDVEHSRRVAARLKELGCECTYEEDPEGLHERRPGLYEDVWRFLLEHTLKRKATTIALKAPYLRWGKARWVRMDAFEQSIRFGQIRAKIDGQTIDVTTENVTAFTLELNEDLVDLKKGLMVVIDGESAFAVANPASGGLSFHTESDPRTVRRRWRPGGAAKSAPGAPVKNARLEGPMSDVFRSRFILVPGTLGDDLSDAVCREEAEWFSRSRWRRIHNTDCIIKPDTEITAADRKDANLVLIGGPDVNALTRRLAPRLPVVFEKDGSITVDGRKLAAPGGALALVRPNPENVDRYVLLFAGTSLEAASGMIEKADLNFDYHAFDEESKDTGSSVLFGVFGRNWQFDRSTQWGRKGEGEAKDAAE